MRSCSSSPASCAPTPVIQTLRFLKHPACEVFQAADAYSGSGGYNGCTAANTLQLPSAAVSCCQSGQYFCAILSDQQCMLKLCCQTAIYCNLCPPVRPTAMFVCAQADDGLNGEGLVQLHHPWPPVTMMKDSRSSMELPAYAMPNKVSDHGHSCRHTQPHLFHWVLCQTSCHEVACNESLTNQPCQPAHAELLGIHASHLAAV